MCIQFARDVELWESSPRWEAQLSNGQTAYYVNDDSWFALKKYCEEEKIYITRFLVGFRDHIEVFSGGSIFFRHGARQNWRSQKTRPLYLVGKVNGEVHIKKYLMPELEFLTEETRSIEECEKGIIWANTSNPQTPGN